MLAVQRLLGWMVLLPIWYTIVGVLKYYRGYSVSNHLEVRQQYRELCRKNSPLLVCCNHLTLIDSVILHWALGTPFWYLRHYNCFLWNIPARENVHKKLIWSLLTFLGKCLLIDRNGGSQHTDQMLNKICTCLKQGDNFLIFPEGTRSRNGSVNVKQVTYGVGKILQTLPGLKVLCVYLRGDNQTSYSDFPVVNERLSIKMQMLTVNTQYSGLRAVRDYANQIIATIKVLEDQYWQELKYNTNQAKAS